jgi:pimeloyl-ACP methyl ester carboxylesterase
VNLPVVTKGINAIVEAELTTEPTLVVGHSLGSVVGYKVICQNRDQMKLAGYVTVGSPLGIRAISTRLGIPENPAGDGWYNAYDDGDIVALNPLDDQYFPTHPPVTNHGGVKNSTDNQHGITGYLDDPDVAAAIATSLARHADG